MDKWVYDYPVMSAVSFYFLDSLLLILLLIVLASPQTCVDINMEKKQSGSKPGALTPQMDALPAELLRLYNKWLQELWVHQVGGRKG